MSVSQWLVVATGLQYDRQWMLIDDKGQFLSQRVLPKMALIKTALNETQLILSAPQQTPLVLPLQMAEGDIIKSVVWQDECAAVHVSKQADQWFSDFLGRSCRLVYLPQETVRSVDSNYAYANDQVAFADAFPFLLIAQSSLTALNTAMSLSLEMRRFRPNLVVSGCESYAEDNWREIRIGDIDFRLPKPCSRCSVPTIDPDSAELGKEPLATLNRLRRWQNKVYFGQNALHNQNGVLRVGDVVQITLTGEKQPPLD
ncbi:MAG: MOSC domain-containing protein [Methylococcaceae bacterium]